ncbi:MAG TPA: hypothetical protein C5S50_07955 [Methanosarcinaceae archaeon]|nr:hypothetical protein [Methanosarcinaceae archaeon]
MILLITFSEKNLRYRLKQPGVYNFASYVQFKKKYVTIQPFLRPDADGENLLICVYGETFISF